jgi:hypothetical protein
MEVHPERRTLIVFAGDGARVIFGGDPRQGELRVHASDAGGAAFGGLIDRRLLNLAPGQYYSLRWRLTPGGTQIWLDGKSILESSIPNDLSSPRPVGIIAFESPVNLRSFVVEPLRTEQAAKY